MKLAIKLTATVRKDLSDARLWYRDQRPGLDEALARSFYLAVEQIAEAPTAQTRYRDEYRKRRLKSFPYSAYFRISGDTLYVTALLHHGRSPQFIAEQLRRE